MFKKSHQFTNNNFFELFISLLEFLIKKCNLLLSVYLAWRANSHIC